MSSKFEMLCAAKANTGRTTRMLQDACETAVANKPHIVHVQMHTRLFPHAREVVSRLWPGCRWDEETRAVARSGACVRLTAYQPPLGYRFVFVDHACLENDQAFRSREYDWSRYDAQVHELEYSFQYKSPGQEWAELARCPAEQLHNAIRTHAEVIGNLPRRVVSVLTVKSVVYVPGWGSDSEGL